MKVRPIIMSAESVRAILAGQKTQTRRAVRGQGLQETLSYLACEPYLPVVGDDSGDLVVQYMADHPRGAAYYASCGTYPDEGTESLGNPYGQPGDRLWVREVAAWNPDLREPENIWYRADPKWDEPDSGYYPDNKNWRSPIHMPRWASRLTLEIVSVRVERLQAITVDDVVAEGINLEGAHAQDFIDAEHAQSAGLNIGCRYPEIYPFVRLWDSINGKRPGCAWQDNPWVWRIEYAQVTP